MYVWRNTESRFFNHYCSGKSISITYSECVFVALGIEHEKRMRRVIIFWPARLYNIFFHIIS